jgi:hypothetical protein
VVGRGDIALRARYSKLFFLQELDSSPVGAVMEQVQIDIEDGRMAGLLRHDVSVPKLVVQRAAG